MYKVEVKPNAKRDIEYLPKNIRVRVVGAIDKLEINPRPSGSKKLKGTAEDLWRIRVSDYRVIYLIADTIQLVQIRRVRHRKDAYSL